MKTHRLLTALASLSIAAGMLVGASTPAHAATIAVDCESDSQSTSVPVGETLTISAVQCTVQSVSGVGTFTPSSGYIVSTVTFTSQEPGTAVLTISNSGQGAPNATVLTITVGGSAATFTDPASVYPSAYLNANGGTCTGALQFTKYNELNGTITLPAADACTRAGYELENWTYTANGLPAPETTWAPFSPGGTVPIGDDNFTLYAQWRPLGVEITYDANVGTADQCLVNGTNTTTRTAMVVVQHPGSTFLGSADGALTASAPCMPPDMVLAGWRIATTGLTGKVYPTGTPVTDLFPGEQIASARIRLAAAWTVTYALTASPAQVSVTPSGATSVTFTATRNGAPAPSVMVAASFSPSGAPGVVGSTRVATTGTDGTASVPILGVLGTGVVSAAYGDATAVVPVTVSEPQPQSIIIIEGRRENRRIVVEGISTGFESGSVLRPWIRFPGEVGFSEGVAEINVDENGDWTWGRNTGKRIAVQIRSEEDSSVRSNTVIIEAR